MRLRTRCGVDVCFYGGRSRTGAVNAVGLGKGGDRRGRRWLLEVDGVGAHRDREGIQRREGRRRGTVRESSRFTDALSLCRADVCVKLGGEVNERRSHGPFPADLVLLASPFVRPACSAQLSVATSTRSSGILCAFVSSHILVHTPLSSRVIILIAWMTRFRPYLPQG